jgi:hypothetical protein
MLIMLTSACSVEVVASVQMELATDSWIIEWSYFRHVCIWAASTFVALRSLVTFYDCLCLLHCSCHAFIISRLSKGSVWTGNSSKGRPRFCVWACDKSLNVIICCHHMEYHDLFGYGFWIWAQDTGWLYTILFYTSHTVVFDNSYSFVCGMLNHSTLSVTVTGLSVIIQGYTRIFSLWYMTSLT